MLQLIKLKKSGEQDLTLFWNDGVETKISFQRLRDECPCAECKGETVLFESTEPKKKSPETPGIYELRQVEVVGNYSIQPIWGDGHNSGLYSWEYLRKISTHSAKS
ncbi:conserved hypothetical protein [Chloroherpeton thalassium ATCC 35110]|uniref:Gamma-butyrobetaine hydroxylase-like N-terminal domain-containing protein n=1 Tax=Chloroherpeton thalassium (strain ATCC 35110 / GB-78) TaxID=517418 RepID=B3QTE7_CHLT3|nr:DUF971 domain-containing protein [Chloroherpeton thalassium]ACF12693.1 conserved hypothetical protein [Chloroherpeton thalassium ATCC 35110]